MSNTSSSAKQMYLVHTYQDLRTVDQKALKVVQNSITVDTVKLHNLKDQSVLFYVASHQNSAGDLVYQLRPVNQPNKYIAISGQDVVLKDSRQVQSDNSHNFVIVSPNVDYTKFKVESSPASSPRFIAHENGGKVTTTTANSSNTWFKVVPVYGVSALTVNKAVLVNSCEETVVEEIVVSEE